MSIYCKLNQIVNKCREADKNADKNRIVLIWSSCCKFVTWIWFANPHLYETRLENQDGRTFNPYLCTAEHSSMRFFLNSLFSSNISQVNLISTYHLLPHSTILYRVFRNLSRYFNHIQNKWFNFSTSIIIMTMKIKYDFTLIAKFQSSVWIRISLQIPLKYMVPFLRA